MGRESSLVLGKVAAECKCSSCPASFQKTSDSRGKLDNLSSHKNCFAAEFVP